MTSSPTTEQAIGPAVVLGVWGLSRWFGAWWLVPLQRRLLLIIGDALVPLGEPPYLKNMLVFGFFSGSSWFGMNLQGEFHPRAVIPSFLELIAYPPSYLQDSVTLIMRHHSGYWFTVSRSWLVFMLPASEYSLLRTNRLRLAAYVDAFDKWVQVRANGPARQPSYSDPRLVDAATILREDGGVHLCRLYRDLASGGDPRVDGIRGSGSRPSSQTRSAYLRRPEVPRMRAESISSG